MKAPAASAAKQPASVQHKLPNITATRRRSPSARPLHKLCSTLGALARPSPSMADQEVKLRLAHDGDRYVMVTVTPPAEGPTARKCICATVDVSYSMNSAANEKGDEMVRWFSKLDIVAHGTCQAHSAPLAWCSPPALSEGRCAGLRP